MKRDMTLIKLLLQYAECNAGDKLLGIYDIDLPNYDREMIAYHIRLCFDAGYVRNGNTRNHIRELTWAGHEALAALRREDE